MRMLLTKKTFCDDVKKSIVEKCRTVRPLNPKASLLLYPSHLAESVIARTLETATCSMFNSDASSSQSEDKLRLLTDSTPLQEIVHTALHLRADLLDTP